MAGFNKETLKAIFIVAYLILLGLLFALYTACIFLQEKFSIPEERIKQIGQWLANFLSILVGYMAGLISG